MLTHAQRLERLHDEVRSSRKPISKPISPRPHQIKLVDEAIAVLESSNHVYVEAPPASGKTLVVGLTAHRLPYATAYYLAHTIDLVDQAEGEIRGYVRDGLIRSDIDWHFMTWRRYANMAKRSAAQVVDTTHVTFVDECHIGGIDHRNGVTKISFPTVVDTSDKVVWVSATPWGLDERMMGGREGAAAHLSYDEAFDRGLLNETDLMRVDCSLDIRVKVAAEVADVRDLHRAETVEIVMQSDSAEGIHSILDDRVREIMDRGLQVGDVPLLVRFRHQLMAELYVARHRGEKAIFWLPTKQHARDCAAHINSLMDRDDYAAEVLGETRGSAEDAAASKALASWKSPRGRTRVVCVVYRLREGFDHPPVAHGFDCAWNPYNYRSTVQKVGRLTRRMKDKPRSLYYYGVDAVTIAAAQSRRIDRRFLDGLGRAYSEIELDITTDAFDDAVALKSAFDMSGERQDVLPVLDQIELGDRAVRTARTPLFDMLSSTGFRQREVLGFRELLRKSADARIEEIIRSIERKPATMPKLYMTRSRNKPHSDLIRSLVTPSHARYDPTIRSRLIACGALVPRERKTALARERLETLVASIESGASMPKTGSPDHVFLAKYYNPANSTYRQEVRDRLMATGALIVRARKPGR